MPATALNSLLKHNLICFNPYNDPQSPTHTQFYNRGTERLSNLPKVTQSLMSEGMNTGVHVCGCPLPESSTASLRVLCILGLPCRNLNNDQCGSVRQDLSPGSSGIEKQFSSSHPTQPSHRDLLGMTNYWSDRSSWSISPVIRAKFRIQVCPSHHGGRSRISSCEPQNEDF